MTVADRALDATYAEVAARGLARLTVEGVAIRAGVSRASLYRHFPGGRDELVDRAIRREVTRFFDTVMARTPPAPPEGSLEDHVTGLVVAAHGELRSHDVLQRLLLDEADAIVPSLATVQPLIGGRITGHLRSVVAATAAAGQLPGDVDVDLAAEHAARVLLSYVGSPGRWQLDRPGEAARLVRTQVLPGLLA